MSNLVIKRRGRPAGVNKQAPAAVTLFNPASVQIITGAELEFDIPSLEPEGSS